MKRNVRSFAFHFSDSNWTNLKEQAIEDDSGRIRRKAVFDNDDDEVGSDDDEGDSGLEESDDSINGDDSDDESGSDNCSDEEIPANKRRKKVSPFLFCWFHSSRRDDLTLAVETRLHLSLDKSAKMFFSFLFYSGVINATLTF